MRKLYESTFVSEMEILEDEMQKLSAFLDNELADSPHAYGISLAFEEIGTNIVKYGNKEEKENHIHVELFKDGDTHVFKIFDDTHPFNPLEEAPEPDTEQSVEERDIGGLGIMLVKNFAKEISYEFCDQKNNLTVTF